MIACGAEGLCATTQITAPQQPHKHTLHEERRTAKSLSLRPPLNTLLYTYLCIMFWILLPSNIMLLKLLLSSLGEKPMIIQQLKAFLSHFRIILNHFFKWRWYCANKIPTRDVLLSFFSFSIPTSIAGLWLSANTEYQYNTSAWGKKQDFFSLQSCIYHWPCMDVIWLKRITAMQHSFIVIYFESQSWLKKNK